MEEMNKELELAQLSQAWAELYDELKKNNKINFVEFEKAFSKTYALLSAESAEEKLDKKCVEMILNAFLFASVESKELTSKCHAALVLTERMLSCCALDTTTNPVETTAVYIFETRKEVRIRFRDVNDSLDKLTRLFDEDFWKNL